MWSLWFFMTWSRWFREGSSCWLYSSIQYWRDCLLWFRKGASNLWFSNFYLSSYCWTSFAFCFFFRLIEPREQDRSFPLVCIRNSSVLFCANYIYIYSVSLLWDWVYISSFHISAWSRVVHCQSTYCFVQSSNWMLIACSFFQQCMFTARLSLCC